jgi:hypothetical protein
MAVSDDWLKGWREEDFAWEGLAKDKPLQGWVVADGVLREAENGRVYGQPVLETPAPASGRLRDDAAMGAELVVAAGQPTYHVAHLPLAYANGAPTGKETWRDDALDAIVAPRLAAASETQSEGPFYDRNIVGPDRDAQLQGGVWAKAPSHPAGKEHALSLRLNFALIFGYCDFAQARFSGDAWFEGAAFSGDARFQRAAFSGAAWFEGAAFSGAARFQRAAFSGDARFEGAAFSGDAVFRDAAFSGNAVFEDAAFSGAAWFAGAAFSGDAVFAGAEIKLRSNFDNAHFKRGVDFAFKAFSGDAGFDGTRFSRLDNIALLAGLIFATGAALSLGALFGADHAAGWLRWLLLILGGVVAATTFGWLLIGGLVLGQDSLASMQVSFRTLKRLCADAHNSEGQALARALELKASRLRPGHNWQEALFSKPFERLFSLSYEIVAGYGQSILLPFLWLLLSGLGFAALYWSWEGGGLERGGAFWRTHALAGFERSVDPEFIDAAAFSASRMFPLGPWGEVVTDDARCSFRERLLHLGTEQRTGPAPELLCTPRGIALNDDISVAAHRLAVQSVATVQSIFAIVLALLLALAVRRRFQIS